MKKKHRLHFVVAHISVDAPKSILMICDLCCNAHEKNALKN
jgi:hypothetical protein